MRFSGFSSNQSIARQLHLLFLIINLLLWRCETFGKQFLFARKALPWLKTYGRLFLIWLEPLDKFDNVM